ncbi:MAG: lytic transglycosylase [Acidimicrobiia bacterium]
MGLKRGAAAVAVVVALLATGAAAGQVHRIERGETLGQLSHRYGVPLAALAEANGIADPDHILAGARLVIPDGGGGGDVVPDRARPVAVPAHRVGLAPLFTRHARSAGVPADLAMALAWQESGWQTGVVSSTKAVGVMQLMPATVEFASRILLRLPADLDPAVPSENIRMGTRFLRYLLDRTGGDVELALASYYQGLRSVRERGVFTEPTRFVANVKALRSRF